MVDEGLGADEGPDQGVVQDGCSQVFGRQLARWPLWPSPFYKVYTVVYCVLVFLVCRLVSEHKMVPLFLVCQHANARFRYDELRFHSILC